MKKDFGFTLIEMMSTVVILGIVLAIAAPSLSQYIAINRAKGFAENLAQDLVMARTEAIRTNQAVQLDVRNGCYGMRAGNTACDCTITDTTSSNHCAIKQVNTSTGMSLTKTSGFNGIVFDPVRGLPVTNTFGTLTATQVLTIENTAAKVAVNLNVIGSVCINSAAGSKKVAGYPAAC
ncbi:GspH/FimT family pseudopilin [Chitinibacter fontanus]|uniref:Type II secretion system protein H n=1 Tax=Chitinibacter fontanus TaxID=1737446 RepID=A0A7D5Z7Y6_9NEIS|nr:GspH/FimT family pseudopilin [Chitinibacter fontanus]QLI80185.1 GspH/FimT family pseudopilin [Chitinibacter fontanus]